MTSTLRRTLATDYGEDVYTACGTRRHLRAGAYRAPLSVPRYVAECRGRRPDLGTPRAEGSVDGRLIAAGWSHVPPREWVAPGGPLDRWLIYWRACAARPDVVGSSHNPDVRAAYRAHRAGVPAWVMRALPTAGGRSWETRHPDGASTYAPPPPHVPRRRVRRLRDAARAAARTSMQHETTPRWSVRALAALGRLTPELQRVAIDATRLPEMGPVRVRDIAWEAVARAQAQFAADASGRARAAWATGRRRASLLPPGVSMSAWLAPAFPGVPVEIAALIARGLTPVQVAASQAGDGLLPHEAHAWLVAGAPLVIPWLRERLGVPDSIARTTAAVRWHAAVERDLARREALHRERTAQHAGAEYRYRYADRLDEIAERHLPRGERTSVDAAFRLAAEEATAGAVGHMRGDLRVLAPHPEWWARAKIRAARVLDTPAALAAEGDALGHCVASYVGAVQQRHSVVVALNVCGARSTVEFTPRGEVRQHRAHANSTPDVASQRALTVMLRRIRGAKGGA